MATFVLLLISLFHILGTLSSVLPDGSSQPDSCNSCCQGAAGLPGVPGSAGIPGSPGSNGLTGRDGVNGEAGIKGEVGQAGMKGEVGQAGSPGVKGPLGPQGPIGERGERGDQGLQGLPGKVGPRGIEGRSGSDGQSGADGRPGPIGLKGSKGDSPQVRQSAFSVIKTSSQTGNTNNVLTFQEAEVNVGSHYSMETHKFTCQIPGTYVFMFTISSNYLHHDPSIELVKDDARITRAAIRDSQSSVNNWHQSSNQAIVQLAVGNQVWLKFVSSGDHVYSNSGKYTSFSGFLLYAE